MRAGLVISVIGHVGAVLITMAAWKAAPAEVFAAGSVVPVEIVTIAPESNVRALAPPVEEEPQPSEESEPETTPIAAETPTPPRPSERPRDRFNLRDARDTMENRDNRGQQQRVEGEASDRRQEGAGLGTAEAVALEDRARAIARAHIARNRCWRAPIDLPDPERLVVEVSFEVDRNGRLRGQPEVVRPRNYRFDPAMNTAVENAVRAIRMCDPWPFADDPQVGPHFEIWRQLNYTFEPRL